MGAKNLRTNLIIHHGVTDVLNQAANFIDIFSAVQEPCNLASAFQWDEVLKDIVKFPVEVCTLDWVLAWGRMGYRLRVFLLHSSLISPSGTGKLSDSASRSTRGINASIVWRHAIVC